MLESKPTKFEISDVSTQINEESHEEGRLTPHYSKYKYAIGDVNINLWGGTESYKNAHDSEVGKNDSDCQDW